jgi:hypothetical protein
MQSSVPKMAYSNLKDTFYAGGKMFVKDGVIGSGSSGSVSRLRPRYSNTRGSPKPTQTSGLVVKEFSETNSGRRDYNHEVEVLTAIEENPWMKDVLLNAASVPRGIVMHYVPPLTLCIHQLNFKARLKVVTDVKRALNLLQQRGFPYFDVKAGNMVMDVTTGKIKLIDLGGVYVRENSMLVDTWGFPGHCGYTYVDNQSMSLIRQAMQPWALFQLALELFERPTSAMLHEQIVYPLLYVSSECTPDPDQDEIGITIGDRIRIVNYLANDTIQYFDKNVDFTLDMRSLFVVPKFIASEVVEATIASMNTVMLTIKETKNIKMMGIRLIDAATQWDCLIELYNYFLDKDLHDKMLMLTTKWMDLAAVVMTPLIAKMNTLIFLIGESNLTPSQSYETMSTAEGLWKITQSLYSYFEYQLSDSVKIPYLKLLRLWQGVGIKRKREN